MVVKNNFLRISENLTWERPQKQHHHDGLIFPVISVQKLSQSVKNSWRKVRFCSFFYSIKKKVMNSWISFKGDKITYDEIRLKFFFRRGSTADPTKGLSLE